MAATLSPLPTEHPPQNSDVSAVLPLTPAVDRPVDAAHEHWPDDHFRVKRQDRAREEHCPPEVYVG